jgi:hypothetical protein
LGANRKGKLVMLDLLDAETRAAIGEADNAVVAYRDAGIEYE